MKGAKILFVFNTMTIGDRTYSGADAKGITSAERYGIPRWEYGGRIKYIGTTDTDVLLLMDSATSAFDTAAETLENIPVELIQKLCQKRKIEFHHKLGKEKLIELLTA